MIKQRTDEWIKARLGVPTSSRFADVLAIGRNGQPLISRDRYKLELAIEMLTGNSVESYINEPMQRGIELEPKAAIAYMQAFNVPVYPAGYYTLEEPRCGTSPDRLVGADGLLEIKCPNSTTHMETIRKGEVPKEYIAQIQGQLWITGRKWCDFVSYDDRMPENCQLFIKRVNRNEEYITKLEQEIAHFNKEVEELYQLLKGYRYDG